MQAAPSYTAVAARQTLQRPPVPVTEPSNSKKVEWSSDVREYVQRSFDRTNLIPGIDAREMQLKLKEVITRAAETGEMPYINWRTYKLPQIFIQEEREQAALSGANMTNIHSLLLPMAESASSPGSSSRKRKSPDTEAEPQEATTPPWRQKAAKNDLEDRITGKSKSQEKKQKKQNAMRAAGVDNSTDAVAKRRQRFGYVTPEPSPYEVSRDQSPDNKPSTGPIVGTCQTLEKNYFRLTAPPPLNVVRPLSVLEKALDLVRQKWKTDHNYTYTCDQLKSIRQDLTVQHIKNAFTVKVYEAHARIALEMADLGEYNQCQTQLRALYKLQLGGGNPEEFMAYRILYILYTCNRVDMNDVLADLTPADKQKPGVKHALQVRAALASGNYHKFFRLYDEAPFMGPYLLDMFVERERLAALSAICRAYKPDVSLQFLATELAFRGADDADESDHDADLRQCLDFICQSGGEHLIQQKDKEVRVAVGKAGQIFEQLRATKFRRVDIKGQI